MNELNDGDKIITAIDIQSADRLVLWMEDLILLRCDNTTRRTLNALEWFDGWLD